MLNFYKKYFLLNLKDYPNIDVDFPITLALFIFFIGLMAVSVTVNFRRSKIELMVRQLKRHNAESEESAKTLKELRLDNIIFKLLLAREGQLTKLVKRVGEKNYSYEEYMALSRKERNEKINFENAKFYLREEGMERSNKIIESHSPTLLNTILLCVFILAIFVCLSLVMPSIMNLIDNYIGRHK
jgi:hypothetical protein